MFKNTLSRKIATAFILAFVIFYGIVSRKFTIIAYALLLVGAIFAVYAFCKYIWYLANVLSLNRKLAKFGAKAVGKKVSVLEKNGKKYEVSVISHPSTHSRFNIEKTADGYMLEIRRYNAIFYNVYNHAEQTDLAIDFKRETKIYRKKLELTPENKDYERQILLFFPKPKIVTYTDTKWEYIDEGVTFKGHTVMFKKRFYEFLKEI